MRATRHKKREVELPHQLCAHQTLLLYADTPCGRQRLLVRFFKFISDHLQKLCFSIVLPFVLLDFDDKPSIALLGVYRIEDLAERTLIDLSLEDKPALEEAFLVLHGPRPLPVLDLRLLYIKRHCASSLKVWG